MADLFLHTDPVDAKGGPDNIRFGRIYLALLVGVLTPLTLLLSFNYYNDHYTVFHDDRNFTEFTNLNFVRMEYLLEHGNEHPLILFGTSRANGLDIRSRINAAAYSFAITGGVAYYNYLHLKTLIDAGIVPETVILGLGEDAIRVPPKPNAQQPATNRLHPLTEAINPLGYFWDYLAFIPTTHDLLYFRKLVAAQMAGRSGLTENSLAFLRSGNFYCDACEQRALQRTDAEHAADLTTGRLYRRGIERKGITLEENAYDASRALATVQKIIDLAAAHDISLTIFIDPNYREKYLNDDPQSLLEFKRQLSQITPFLDFNNLDSTFAEPRNFIDIIHYNREVGARLTEDIARVMEGRVDETGLGTWVTAANVDRYLQQQQARYQNLQP